MPRVSREFRLDCMCIIENIFQKNMRFVADSEQRFIAKIGKELSVKHKKSEYDISKESLISRLKVQISRFHFRAGTSDKFLQKPLAIVRYFLIISLKPFDSLWTFDSQTVGKTLHYPLQSPGQTEFKFKKNPCLRKWKYKSNH